MITAAVAKCIGRGHIATFTPCQDSVLVRSTNSVSCIALSDGAGSKQFSEKGSQKCVEAVAKYVTKHFDGLIELAETKPEIASQMIVRNVLGVMQRFGKKNKIDIEDMACTLIFAAFKGNNMLLGHIGDGVIAVINNDSLDVFSFPENGEYANSTYFITDNDAISRFRIYTAKSAKKSGVMLMSDGTAESLFNRATKELAPAVKTIFSWAERLNSKKLGKVLEQNLINVFSNSTKDDCSIAVLFSR